MPIIGLNYRSFEGSRTDTKTGGNINVNSTPKITDVKEITVPEISQKALSMSFEFATKYDPDIGTVKITGDLLYTAKDPKKIFSQWKKNKSLPVDVSTEVLNHLFRTCLLKLAFMADDLRLPPPVQIPRVRPKQDEGAADVA